MTATSHRSTPRAGSNADRVIKYIQAYGASTMRTLSDALDVELTVLANSLTFPRDCGMVACAGFGEGDVVSVPGCTTIAQAVAPAAPVVEVKWPTSSAKAIAESARPAAQKPQLTSTVADAPFAPQRLSDLPADTEAADAFVVPWSVDLMAEKTAGVGPKAESGSPVVATPASLTDLLQQAATKFPIERDHAASNVMAESALRSVDWALWGGGKLTIEVNDVKVELLPDETLDFFKYLDVLRVNETQA